MDDIGLKLQISVKLPKGNKPATRPNYLHGYVVASALYELLDTQILDSVTVLETGTARGFSSLIMAIVINKFEVPGKIHTIDNISTFDNCLKSAKLGRKISIEESVEEWKDIVDKYIIFEKGDSKKILADLDKNLNRINFAFLDGAHHYKDLKRELEFVEPKQQKDDVIVVDDYTKTQFPEIVKAVDEFIEKGTYDYKIFYGDDGHKKRGYVYLSKK
jgi:predicted O-methyltransferase YrrM